MYTKNVRNLTHVKWLEPYCLQWAKESSFRTCMIHDDIPKDN